MTFLKAIAHFVPLFFAVMVSAQPIPLDTAVRTGKLPNGFTYYIRHNTEPRNRVFLYLVNKVGAILEDDDQRGLAHFMEHMNFNGTTHFPKNELVDYLQRSGVRFGADLNAYTSFDETVYQLPLPADDTAILRNGFQIMRDWAQDATLDSIEIDKERGVVLEEERLGRGAGERMRRVFLPVLFNQSRYANRQPIGKVDILQHFPASAIRRFHQDWYRPDLQALVVVGDIDPAKIETRIRTLFSDLKTPVAEKSRVTYNVPLTGKNQFLIVTDQEMPQTELEVFYKHKAEKLITEADYLKSLERSLINQMLAGRFEEQSQTANLPYLEASAGISGFLGGLDAFTFAVGFKQDRYKEGFQLAWKLLEQSRRFGFTASELDRASRELLSNLQKSVAEQGKTASTSFVNEYQRLFLNSEASPGVAWEYRFSKDHFSNISLSELNRLTQEYLADSNRDVIILAPAKDKAGLPDSATVSGWIDAVNRGPLTAYKDEVSDQQLLTAKPVPGTIVKSSAIPSIGATGLLLSNGVQVILKPTNFKNDEILFGAFASGGSSVYPDPVYPNAANAGVIAGFGVGSINPVQLQKMLSGKVLSVTPQVGELSQGLRGSASVKDLETALQLTYAYFISPRKDTTIFRNIVTGSVEQLKNRYSDPRNVFADTVTRILGNYSPRRAPQSVEKIRSLDLDKLYSIYRERFADAAGFTFVFVGNFNPDSIRPLLTTYLASLPSTYKKERGRDLGIRIPAGQLTKAVFQGTESKATIRMVLSGDYEYGPDNNILLTALKEVLSIKVIEHLREDESEVYAPGVQVSYEKIPAPRYTFNISFGCAPANADHLMEAVSKEIAAVRDHGPSAADLDKFKAEYKRVYEQQLTENGNWLNYLLRQYEYGEDPAQMFGFPARLEKLTPAMLQAAAKKYLSGANLIRFELLPETR